MFKDLIEFIIIAAITVFDTFKDLFEFIIIAAITVFVLVYTISLINI